VGEDKVRYAEAYAEASKAFNEALRAKVAAGRSTLEDLMRRTRPVEEHEDAAGAERDRPAGEV
jgi:hypothetical protein